MRQFESFIDVDFWTAHLCNLHCSAEISFLAGSQHDRIQAERN